MTELNEGLIFEGRILIALLQEQEDFGFKVAYWIYETDEDGANGNWKFVIAADNVKEKGSRLVYDKVFDIFKRHSDLFKEHFLGRRLQDNLTAVDTEYYIAKEFYEMKVNPYYKGQYGIWWNGCTSAYIYTK